MRPNSLPQTDLFEQVHRPASTPTQSPNNQSLHLPNSTLYTLQTLFHMLHHSILIRIRFQTCQTPFPTLFMLSHKSQSTRCCSSESCVKAESCYSPFGLWMLEILEVVQTAFTLGESTKNGRPAVLTFVAVSELYMSMRKGIPKRVSVKLQLRVFGQM